ncbi:MAG: cadherin repeat domain-containing protein [Planctomycetota bacterium]|nr:cadherin repeat domain-containing protein [Planctomycetota bacterium]MDA1178669.1 cadherin repeat domain-containing protein [Planctomycetota bacterium]
MKREKLLASAGAAAILLLVLFSVFSYVRSEFQKRTDAEQKIQENIRARQAEVRQGKIALQTLRSLESRALRAGQGVDQSQTRYQQWLLDRVNRCGLDGAYVQSNNPSARKNGDVVLSFRLGANGTLPECLAWWQEFYSLERLHLMRNVTLTPQEGTRRLKIEATVEVYAMAAATDREVADGPPRALEAQRESAELIMARNFFVPPNHPPTLDVPALATHELGATLTLQATGKDPDPGDKLRFELVDPPNEATIDATTGEIKWQPAKEGQLDLTVRVQDDGSPPLNALQKITVNVHAATSKDRSQFALDDAKQAYFCGMTSGDDETNAWLQVRTTGVLHLLKAGDSLHIGSVSASVLRVNSRDLELLLGDRQVTLRLGQSLASVLPE